MRTSRIGCLVVGLWGLGWLCAQEVSSSELIPFEEEEELAEVSPAVERMQAGVLELEEGNVGEAILAFEGAIEEEPRLFRAWEALGWAYWEVGREEEAVELWERLVRIAPDEPSGYNQLARVATLEGELEGARELYERSLALNPDQFEVLHALARVKLWSGQWAESVEMLRELLAEEEERLDVEIDLAWALYANTEYEESLRHWDRINEKLPGEPGFLLARGRVRLLVGMLEEAREDMEAVLAEDPESEEAMGVLVQLSIRRDRPRESVERMEALLEMAEEESTRQQVAREIAEYMSGVREERPEEFTRAEVVRAARRAWEIDRRNVTAALFYGEALVGDRQYRSAAEVFTFVLEELNPMNERAKTGMLETYFGRRMLEEAEGQLRENLRAFNPENPFRHTYWARLHFARGDFPAAMRALDELEKAGAEGAVFALVYGGISPSEWSEEPSVRQLREQLMALRKEGFRFVVPSQIDEVFEGRTAPPVRDPRPWSVRMLENVRYGVTGEEPDRPELLGEVSPEKVVMVTFDGGLRNSFRYGTEVAEELGIPMAMFMDVGSVLDMEERFVAPFPEARGYVETGYWEIHSRLRDAGRLRAADEEGRLARPLPNRLWLEQRERIETIREYQQRIRREFRASKRVLSGELGIPEREISAVAYPNGDVGQEAHTNIDLFNVAEFLMNEAAIHYRQGFIQYRAGYVVKGDNPLLYKRYSPDRHATGREVVRQAYLQHPVYTARRMRVEMAALQGEVHLAQENLEKLRRDGYPEEEIRELEEYVHRHLGRLIPAPEEPEGEEGWGRGVRLREPYIGVDGRVNRANVVIDDRSLGVFAGMELTPRVSLRVHGRGGSIRQTVQTNTVVEVEETTESSSRSVIQRVENGDVTNIEETRTTFETVNVLSNRVERLRFDADYLRVGGQFNILHDAGSLTMLRGGYYELGPEESPDDSTFTWGAEHQWRPFPVLDVAAVYQRDVVPSARELIPYDLLGLRPTWRIRDDWHALALGSFAYYEDRNSMLRAEVENFWRISHELDLWLGLHNSVITTDMESEMYWSPFWDQRHFLILRLRHTYPNYYAMLRAHYGIQKSRARRREREEFDELRVQAEQEGFSPGLGPDESWGRILGFAATLNRQWRTGWETGVEFTVDHTEEFTEHTVGAHLLYRF